MSNTSNLFAIGSCRIRVVKGHDGNLIFRRKSDSLYETITSTINCSGTC